MREGKMEGNAKNANAVYVYLSTCFGGSVFSLRLRGRPVLPEGIGGLGLGLGSVCSL
jgi:hypothetical protein